MEDSTKISDFKLDVKAFAQGSSQSSLKSLIKKQQQLNMKS